MVKILFVDVDCEWVLLLIKVILLEFWDGIEEKVL